MLTKFVAIGLSLLLAGCGTTATVFHRGGAIEGEIVRTDDETMRVQDSAGIVKIRRASIYDIDHPGNVHATIGGVLMIYGVVNIVVGVPKCDEQGGAYCTGVFLPSVVGAGLLIWGRGVWQRSKRLAMPRYSTSELSLAPWIVWSSAVGQTQGLALVLRH